GELQRLHQRKAEDALVKVDGVLHVGAGQGDMVVAAHLKVSGLAGHRSLLSYECRRFPGRLPDARGCRRTGASPACWSPNAASSRCTETVTPVGSASHSRCFTLPRCLTATARRVVARLRPSRIRRLPDDLQRILDAGASICEISSSEH